MKVLSLFLFSLLSFNAFAADILVQDLYIRLLMPNAKVTAAYAEIFNTTKKDISLVKVESDVSDKVEIHNHVKQNGMVKMVEVKSVKIKAGAALSMRPGSYHIMLIGLKNKLKLNQKHKMKLIFSDKSIVETDAVVRSISLKKTMAPKHHHPVKQ